MDSHDRDNNTALIYAAMRGSNLFYDGQLINGKADPTGQLRLHTTRGQAEQPENSTSLFNPTEVARVVELANAHAKTEGTTAVLTMYKTQKQKIEERVSSEVEVLTVDASQGQEFDHVVLSCVVDGARPSFLRDNRRMNVALSRAKKTLDIVCHASLPSNLPVIAAMQTAASGGIVALGHPVSMGWQVSRGHGRDRSRGGGRGRGF